MIPAKPAIVTLAIGAEYLERFERHCRAGWTEYCRRHDLDLVVFGRPLDTSARAQSRSPAWQKCLVLSTPELKDRERVIWVDADICINPQAPSILDGVPVEKVGAMDEHRFPSLKSRQRLLDAIIASSPADGEFGKRYWESWREPGAWHAFTGLPRGQKHIVQSGVMVLSQQHRGLLEHVYEAYEDGGSQRFNRADSSQLKFAGWGEMAPLSHEIQARGLEHWIDPKFNALLWWMFLDWSIGLPAPPSHDRLSAFVREAHRKSHFLHFAGAAHLMPLAGKEST
jgi:hypothetical protein